MSSTVPPYSTTAAAREVFQQLLADPSLPLPNSVTGSNVSIHAGSSGEYPVLPTPWRETEAIAALKALEAAVAIALGHVRYGMEQTASVDADHATVFLFMSYLSTIDGHGKWDPRSVERLKPTDIHRAQSNLYRRLSANMYETKERGVYYHTHGSLDATPTLEMLGLPAYRDELTDYDEICNVIQKRCEQFTAEELDRGTAQRRQAGAIVYTEEDFLNTDQGKAVSTEPLFSMKQLEADSPPAPFAPAQTASGKPQLLTGVKVLDLTRVIAGPVISRTLAEYGATVLKITSPNLPDVPYYQVDLNFGKRTAELDLHGPDDRKVFESLLEDVDVVVDGYRTGSLDRLGYGPDALREKLKDRGKGFVYVAENCFGFTGPWKERSGWQPIADAVSGLAWGHGRALGLNEPVLPPYPLSDYGTGELGAVAALTGLLHRATTGGSYFTSVSLTRYNLWVQSLGQYPEDVWKHMLATHSQDEEFRKLGHLSNFDVVSKAAVKSMKRLHPSLFSEKYMFDMEAPGFGGVVRSCRPVVSCSGTVNGWNSTTRPNGWDRPSWNE